MHCLASDVQAIVADLYRLDGQPLPDLVFGVALQFRQKLPASAATKHKGKAPAFDAKNAGVHQLCLKAWLIWHFDPLLGRKFS
jgi:hypothetical protein